MTASEAGRALQSYLGHYNWVSDVIGDDKRSVLLVFVDTPPNNYRNKLPSNYKGFKVIVKD